MTAKALLEHEPNPTRERIKEAISGNLCRCTGYQQIFEAIEEAATARMSDERLLGKARRRVDGRAKVTGATALRRRPRAAAHAAFASCCARRIRTRKIVSIRSYPKRASHPGVHLVLTGKDFPVTFGILPVSPGRIPARAASACATSAIRSPR